MQKTYFHNRKHIIEDKVRKKTISLEYIDQKRIVDINNLLNREYTNRPGNVLPPRTIVWQYSLKF